MGRAERRKAERRERIEERKGKVLVDRKDINALKDKAIGDVSEHHVQALMIMFGLAEHRLYGFGVKRISRTFHYIDEMMGDLETKYTLEDFKQMLSDEVGIDVTGLL